MPCTSKLALGPTGCLIVRHWYASRVTESESPSSRCVIYAAQVLLLMNSQDINSIPIDLFLGGMCSELHHLMKPLLPGDVCEYYSNSLPNARLALLVFSEFTPVDPTPVATLPADPVAGVTDLTSGAEAASTAGITTSQPAAASPTADAAGLQLPPTSLELPLNGGEPAMAG